MCEILTISGEVVFADRSKAFWIVIEMVQCNQITVEGDKEESNASWGNQETNRGLQIQESESATSVSRTLIRGKWFMTNFTLNPHSVYFVLKASPPVIFHMRKGWMAWEAQDWGAFTVIFSVSSQSSNIHFSPFRFFSSSVAFLLLHQSM